MRPPTACGCFLCPLNQIKSYRLPAPIRPYRSSQQSGHYMASRTTPQDFYSSSSPSSSYQPQALQQIATFVPVQRSRSLPSEPPQILEGKRSITSIGNRPSASSLSNVSHTPPQYQTPPQPAAPTCTRLPSPRPQPKQPSARREFQTGASLAAVTYQSSPQKQYPALPPNIMYAYPAYHPQAYAPYAPHYLTANEFGFPTGPVTVFPYSSSYPRFSTEMSVMPVPQPWYPSHPHHHHQHSAPAVYYTMPQQHMGYLPHNTQPQMIPHGQMVYPNEPHLRRHSVPRRPINMQISPARMTPISPPAPNFQATNSNIGKHCI